MANPLNVPLVADTWTVIATNVTTCEVEIVKDNAPTRITYRLTGGAAPTLASQGTAIDEWVDVRHSAGVDVYAKAKGKAGEVRVYA